MSQTLPCIKCDAPLENLADEGFNQPSGGLEFFTYGHYGSAQFDPMNGERLVLNVCDNCLGRLIKHQAIGHHANGKTPMTLAHQ